MLKSICGMHTGCSPAESKKASSAGTETSVSEAKAKGVFAVIALHELRVFSYNSHIHFSFNVNRLNGKSNDMTIRNLPFISCCSTDWV